MITILAGILAIVFSTVRIYLTIRERQENDRIFNLEKRLRAFQQAQPGSMPAEGNALLDEKQLIVYRLKAFAKIKRMALFMSISLLVVSAVFLVITIVNRP
ncbi:MAG TPA: hypothetical protein VD905_13440 [Flavobacteriales bacterium]|nr:hypothetical protein [Flavobacteriales bacterium]